MAWEDDLLALWDDLEQQAEGLALRQRDAEVADLARSEYAEVDLLGRLLASAGRPVELTVSEVGVLRGRLGGAGAGWCLVVEEPVDGAAGSGVEWVVPLHRLVAVRGLGEGATGRDSRPVTARLGLGSVVRRLAERRVPLAVVVEGGRRSGRLGRVGADFLELRTEEGRLEVVPFGAVAALRVRVSPPQ